MEEALSPAIADAADEDARTIARKGTGRGRAEILARERRRFWTLDQKRTIVGESLSSELTPTEVARKYAISSGLLYSWRQQVVGSRSASSLELRRILRGSSCPLSCGDRTVMSPQRRRFLRPCHRHGLMG